MFTSVQCKFSFGNFLRFSNSEKEYFDEGLIVIRWAWGRVGFFAIFFRDFFFLYKARFKTRTSLYHDTPKEAWTFDVAHTIKKRLSKPPQFYRTQLYLCSFYCYSNPLKTFPTWNVASAGSSQLVRDRLPSKERLNPLSSNHLIKGVMGKKVKINRIRSVKKLMIKWESLSVVMWFFFCR